ncbi:hypothetical protein [Micromonospora chersina]|uniref:hypothetical protein n=1 Tax=Micromonospora chersina TaxID=47854 RepID=UPI00371445F4
MTKLLFVNPEADALTGQMSGSHWQLTEDTDLTAVRARIEEAITARSSVTVPVLLPGGEGRTADLTLNAAALLAIALVEVGSPPGDGDPTSVPGAGGAR